MEHQASPGKHDSADAGGHAIQPSGGKIAVGKRRRGIAGLQPYPAAIGVGNGVVRVKFYGSIDIGRRLLISAQPRIKPSQIVIEARIGACWQIRGLLLLLPPPQFLQLLLLLLLQLLQLLFLPL